LHLALATPIAALLACLWRPARERMLSLLVLAPLPALAVALAALLNPDAMPTLILDPDRRIGLMLDRPGAILLGVAALLWSAAGAYAATYLRGKPHGGRFAVFWLLTLTGSLGVFVAADLLSFYLTFALVSLAAWGLVAHDGTPARDGPASSICCWRSSARSCCCQPSSCWRMPVRAPVSPSRQQ
jgi:formate hydrogenlyase subunit 3/multisubunit Na+/H+ antiporter MnhD subunit